MVSQVDQAGSRRGVGVQGVSLRRIPEGLPGAGIAVVRLHYSADPTMTAQRVFSLRERYTSEARWRREMEIEYEALEGELLYPEFSRQHNLIAPFDVSDAERWTIWMALDPHPRTAHAMVWEAFNSRHDRVVCGEFWPEFGTRYGPTDGIRWKVRDYVQAIQLFESDSECKPAPFEWARGKRLKVHRRLMDTYGKASNADAGDYEDYFDQYRKIGMEFSKEAINRPSEQVNLHFDAALKGQNNLAKAYDSIGRALQSRIDAPPALRVFADCYETIEEFENVRYPKSEKKRGDDFGLDVGAGKDAGERPISYQKHCLDCLAYIETARPQFMMAHRPVSTRQPIYPNTAY